MKPWCFAGLLAASVLLTTPVTAQRLPDSPFGIVCPWGGLKDIGVKWVRSGAGATSFDWRNHEKVRGQYDFGGSDGEINGVGKNEDLGYLVLLGYSPKWASSGPNGEETYPPKDLRDWSQYVYQIVHHYKGLVKYWEIWNEQDIGFFRGIIDDYVCLLRSAYIAAHKADPDCKVVFGGLAGVNLPYLERAYQLGAGPYFDVMAVHPYQWGDVFHDDWFANQLNSLRTLMTRYGDPQKPIWLTEFGWNTGDKAITQEVQARLLVQSAATCLSLEPYGIDKYFWFVVKDWGGPGYGLLDTDGKHKLAADTYAVVTRKLTGAKYLGSIPLGDKVRCLVYRPSRQPNKLLAVLWSAVKEPQPVKLNLGASAAITDMFGKELPASNSIVEATPNPVYLLVDASALKSRIKPYQAPRYPAPKAYSQRKDVWIHLQPPTGTSRAWFAKGIQEEAVLVVHNDSNAPTSGALEAKIQGAPGTAVKKSFKLAAGTEQKIAVRLPIPAKYGLAPLHIRAKADGKELIPLSVPVRIAPGPVIEYLANSSVEHPYFVGKEPGGAPSIRFGGPWTYQFDLSKAKSAEIALLVGDDGKSSWMVSASRDDKNYLPLLSDSSNRSWRKAALDSYCGGKLYLKFEGPNIQLAELVLRTSPEARKGEW